MDNPATISRGEDTSGGPGLDVDEPSNAIIYIRVGIIRSPGVDIASPIGQISF